MINLGLEISSIVNSQTLYNNGFINFTVNGPAEWRSYYGTWFDPFIQMLNEAGMPLVRFMRICHFSESPNHFYEIDLNRMSFVLDGMATKRINNRWETTQIGVLTARDLLGF